MRLLLADTGWDQLGSAAHNPHWSATREWLLSGILGVGALLSTLALLARAVPILATGQGNIPTVPLAALGTVWALVCLRSLCYVLRGGTLVVLIYLVGLSSLLHAGYSEDVHILLTACSLFTLLFFGPRAGLGALVLSVATLALGGWAISSGVFQPLGPSPWPISTATVWNTTLNFVLVIGTLQVGITALLQSLHIGWQREHAARTTLEQQVAERTRELTLARDKALLASQHEAAQKAYLAALHDTTLDLLDHHTPEELFDAIVKRAAAILDAPFCELMLREGDLLVVHATTPNQAALLGERVGRADARLSWQVCDTGLPVTLDDYAAWPQRREVYSPMALHAVADFPIIVGEECRGVLALGRDLPNQPFTEDAIVQGMQFARLIALVLEHARLYDTALTEIAERTQAEAALQQFADELQIQNEDLDAFARTVAHDLKIPLSNVIGYSQLLLSHRDTLDPAQEQEFLEIISTTGHKMNRIINDLLLLARVRSLESVPITDVPMALVVAEAVERLRPLIAETQATIHTPAHWPRSIGYGPWVEEVWANYLSNALKYGGEPPRIELGADEAAEGLVRFWVQDNGPGLSEEQRAQIFAPFTRFHAGRATGHGLGLSIVERIITKQGGGVSVESAPGAGCRFCFTLPAEHPALLAERTV